MKIQLYTICISLLLAACGSRNEGNSTARDSAVENWIEKGIWRQGWEVNPDQSLDTAEFHSRYSANPARWEKAFAFLAATDLANKEPGRYEIDGEQIYAIVQEYTGKAEADTKFEAHKKYADIQYVIKGREQIGVRPLASVEEIEPYDDEKDIAFFSSAENNYRPASPDNFFIFFPDDSHRPSVKASDGEQVKKVVVKVKL